MMMAVDRGGLTWFVTGTEETEGVGEAHVEERSHLCFAAIEQASSIIFYLGVMEGPKLKLKTESLNGEHDENYCF
jgi:hypothetical protein